MRSQRRMIIDHEWRRIMAAVVAAPAWLRASHTDVRGITRWRQSASPLPCNCRDPCATRAAMSDAQGSAQAVLLKAWMADVRRIAGRSAHEIAQCPAPPARLTRDDCAAAGFRIQGPMSARYHSDVFFQVNFSADFAHQAMLIERRRRRARAGWHGALLWKGGRHRQHAATARPRCSALSAVARCRFFKDFLKFARSA